MEFNCKMVPLPDLLETIIDNRGRTVPTVENGIKLIATNCILNEKLFPVYEKIRYVSQETYETWFRAHPKPGDIIFVNKGTPGKVCLIPDPIDFCIAQDMMAFRVKKDIVYNKYLLAVLRSKKIQMQIANTTVGFVIPHFKKSQLKELLIPIPSMDIQKKIGDIYFKLSYKEELNNQINNNLLKIATEYFEDEIYRKKETNWKKYSLKDLSKITNGYSYKGNELVEKSNVGMATIKNFERTGGFKLEGFKPILTDRPKENQYATKNDILIACTDLTQNAEIIGNAILLLNTKNFEKVIISMDLVKAQSNNTLISNWFLYGILNSKEFKNFALGYKSGTTVLHLNKKCLEDFEIQLPNKDIIEKVSKVIEKIYQKSSNILEENQKLEQLRDTLLPKLMNGEIDLDKIEI